MSRQVGELLASINVSRMMDDTRQIAAFERLSGSKEEAEAFDYIANELRQAGLETKLYQHTALISLPIGATLTVGGNQYPSITHSFSSTTKDGGVAAKAVYVAAGERNDYSRINVKGRIALITGLAMPAKVQLAQEQGAVGEIFLNEDPYVHNMIISPVWGSPDTATSAQLPRTPVISVAAKTAQQLLDLLKDDPEILFTLTTTVKTEWTKIPLLVADISGTKEDNYVLVSGHVDSWHFGAMDNGTANAGQLEMARLIAKKPPYRGVRFAFWSGHSHGRYAGSAWYADNFWSDLNQHCVAHINVDSLGAQGADLITGANCMPETKDIAVDVLAELTGQQFKGSPVGRSGDQSFVGIGIPSLLMTISEQASNSPHASKDFAIRTGDKTGGLGWWWHTTEDTIDKIDPKNLLRDTKVYLSCLAKLCYSPILPLNYLARAKDIVAALADHKAKYSSSGLAELLNDLSITAASLQQATKHLEQHIEQTKKLVDMAANSTEQVAALNNTLIDLGRALIPVLHTRAGRFGHDPATSVPYIPALAVIDGADGYDLDEDERNLAAIRLQRGVNKVHDALLTAILIVDSLLVEE